MIDSKRPAYEPAARLFERPRYDPDMRRPPSTVAGAAIVLLRVIAGVVWLAALALQWPELLKDSDVVIDGASVGPEGTSVGLVIVFVIFGAPAAGGAVPTAYLPALWRTLGPYLPAGAGTTAVRNTLYFDGNAIGSSVVILLTYLLLGAAEIGRASCRERVL